MESHCPKSNPNFRDITNKVEENEILQEIFRVISRFPAKFHVIQYSGKSIDHLWDSAVCAKKFEFLKTEKSSKTLT